MVDPPAVTVSDRPPCLTSITPTSSCVLKEQNAPEENPVGTSKEPTIKDSTSRPPCETSWEPPSSDRSKGVGSMSGCGEEETSSDEASREEAPPSSDPAVMSVDTSTEEQGQAAVSHYGPVKRALRRRRADYREEEEHEVSDDSGTTSSHDRRPTRQAKKSRMMSYNDEDYEDHDDKSSQPPATKRASANRDRLNTLLSAAEKQSARGNTRVATMPSLYSSMSTTAGRSSQQQQQPRLQSSLFTPGDMRSPNLPASMGPLLPYQGFPMAGYPTYPTPLGGYPMYYGGGAELLGDYQSTAMAAGLSPQMQPRWLKSKPDSKSNTSSSAMPSLSMPMTSQGLMPDPAPLYGMFNAMMPPTVSQPTGSMKSNRSSSSSGSGNNASAGGRAPRSMEQSLTFPQYGMPPLPQHQAGMMPYGAEGYPPMMMMWRPDGADRMMQQQQPPAQQDMGQMAANSGSYSMLRPPPAPAPAADRRTPKELPPFEETRSGRWSAQEKAFANMIVRYFRAGVLDIPEGTTLRVYLSTRLKCNPMRVSKKFGGLGSLAYRQRSFPSPTNEEIDAAEAHLNSLEARLLASEAEAQS